MMRNWKEILEDFLNVGGGPRGNLLQSAPSEGDVLGVSLIYGSFALAILDLWTRCSDRLLLTIFHQSTAKCSGPMFVDFHLLVNIFRQLIEDY